MARALPDFVTGLAVGTSRFGAMPMTWKSLAVLSVQPPLTGIGVNVPTTCRSVCCPVLSSGL